MAFTAQVNRRSSIPMEPVDPRMASRFNALSASVLKGACLDDKRKPAGKRAQLAFPSALPSQTSPTRVPCSLVPCSLFPSSLFPSSLVPSFPRSPATPVTAGTSKSETLPHDRTASTDRTMRSTTPSRVPASNLGPGAAPSNPIQIC